MYLCRVEPIRSRSFYRRHITPRLKCHYYCLQTSWNPYHQVGSGTPLIKGGHTIAGAVHWQDLQPELTQGDTSTFLSTWQTGVIPHGWGWNGPRVGATQHFGVLTTPNDTRVATVRHYIPLRPLHTRGGHSSGTGTISNINVHRFWDSPRHS